MVVRYSTSHSSAVKYLSLSIKAGCGLGENGLAVEDHGGRSPISGLAELSVFDRTLFDKMRSGVSRVMPQHIQDKYPQLIYRYHLGDSE